MVQIIAYIFIKTILIYIQFKQALTHSLFLQEMPIGIGKMPKKLTFWHVIGRG